MDFTLYGFWFCFEEKLKQEATKKTYLTKCLVSLFYHMRMVLVILFPSCFYLEIFYCKNVSHILIHTYLLKPQSGHEAKRLASL